ncbi:MAG: cytochrome ubiquinol oxidase subunit I, partial [Bryobacteraceae bacterium]
HPVAYLLGPNGEIRLDSIWGLIFNPWILWQYAHNMTAAVVTGSFVMISIGSYYLLSRMHEEQGRLFVRTGVIAGLIATIVLLFPTGDGQGKNVAKYQPITLAAMEGLFENTAGAPIVLVGQLDSDNQRLDNPITVPNVLSFLTYQRWNAVVKGLNDFPRDQWPDNIPLLYYCYHIMVGLGTVFVGVMLISAFALWRGFLFQSRPLLWILLLILPFPYIATTAGWMTAEIGRQPWLIYGVMRTAVGYSDRVSAGNGLFTLLGFMGMYLVLGVLFLFMVVREIDHGPEAPVEVGADPKSGVTPGRPVLA